MIPDKIGSRSSLNDFEKKIKEGNRKLLDMILNEKESQVIRFIKNRIKNLYEVNAVFEGENTFLHYAVKIGKIGVTKALIDSGAYLNGLNKKKLTPLHLGVIKKKFEIVKILVENQAELDSEDILGRTPLHYCCLYCIFFP